ncbi:MAG: IS701 family transposase, partial [Planktothrix sp.]
MVYSSLYKRKSLPEIAKYVVAIRSNHGVWLPLNQKVRANKWCKFERTFSDHKSEIRYIRE